jgi:hypothetical protein
MSVPFERLTPTSAHCRTTASSSVGETQGNRVTVGLPPTFLSQSSSILSFQSHYKGAPVPDALLPPEVHF